VKNCNYTSSRPYEIRSHVLKKHVGYDVKADFVNLNVPHIPRKGHISQQLAPITVQDNQEKIDGMTIDEPRQSAETDGEPIPQPIKAQPIKVPKKRNRVEKRNQEELESNADQKSASNAGTAVNVGDSSGKLSNKRTRAVRNETEVIEVKLEESKSKRLRKVDSKTVQSISQRHEVISVDGVQHEELEERKEAPSTTFKETTRIHQMPKPLATLASNRSNAEGLAVEDVHSNRGNSKEIKEEPQMKAIQRGGEEKAKPQLKNEEVRPLTTLLTKPKPKPPLLMKDFTLKVPASLKK